MTKTINALRSSRWLPLWILLGYGALSVLMTWPIAAQLSSAYAGARSDLWIHQWTYWWVREALLSGQSPFYTDLLYYPQGVALTSHNIAWFNIGVWLPLQALLGDIAAYNVIFITVFALNGFAFYLLARELTGRVSASFLGGIVFGFWPYTMSHYDHPNMMVTFWVPLALFLLTRALRRKSILFALLGGVALAMVGITRWQLLVMSAPLIGLYLAYLLLRDENNGRAAVSWGGLGLLLLAGGLALLLMAPLAAPLVLDQLGRAGPEAITVIEADRGVTDLLGYVMPPDLYGRIWPASPAELPYDGWQPYHTIAASTYYVPYIGLVTLLLALLGVVGRWRRTWPWLLLALGTMLFALGPELSVNGRIFADLPLPYRLVEESLLGAVIRRPHRLNVFLGLPVGMLVVYGTAVLQDWLAVRGREVTGTAVAFGFGALILWENPVPPIPTTTTHVPQWYQDLAADPDEFAILEIPFHNRGFDKLYMAYQTTHGKPIVGGHVSRLPQDAFAFIDSVPFLQPLNSVYTWDVVEESWVSPRVRDVGRQFSLLDAAGVRYVVLNKPQVPAGFLAQWRDWVVFEPTYEDDEVLVYRTTPIAGSDFDIIQPMTPNLGVIRTGYAPELVSHGGVIKVDVDWGATSPPEAEYRVCFALRDGLGGAVALRCMNLLPGWPVATWGTNDVARGSYVLPVAETIPPGDYVLEMTLRERDTAEPAGVAVALGDVTVVPFDPAFKTSMLWHEGMTLRGFDFDAASDNLTLTLYWQAAPPLSQSHKRFAHLVDPQTGAIVAQSDAVPRDWTYPTTIWEEDELVRDSAQIDLEDVSPGEYDLRLGWYAAEGGEPLLACRGIHCSGSAAYHNLGRFSVPAP